MGMTRCEQLASDAARENKLAWPPTYAEFIGYCQPPKADPKPPEHKTIPRTGLPEPKEHREKRRKIGMQKCRGLMDMLDS